MRLVGGGACCLDVRVGGPAQVPRSPYSTLWPRALDSRKELGLNVRKQRQQPCVGWSTRASPGRRARPTLPSPSSACDPPERAPPPRSTTLRFVSIFRFHETCRATRTSEPSRAYRAHSEPSRGVPPRQSPRQTPPPARAHFNEKGERERSEEVKTEK